MVRFPGRKCRAHAKNHPKCHQVPLLLDDDGYATTLFESGLHHSIDLIHWKDGRGGGRCRDQNPVP